MHKATELKIARELGIDPVNVCTVGSTLICGKGNDLDLLCLIPSVECLLQAGFQVDREVHYDSPLRSWRRGDINIIAVFDRAFFLAEVAIAHAARTFHQFPYSMSRREQRVEFHGAVRRAVLEHMEPQDDLL